MRILVTGVTGYVGGSLVPRLQRDGHELVGLSRRGADGAGPSGVTMVAGDAFTGAGLARALEGVEVAFYLIHSMERASSGGGGFADAERRSAEHFAGAARAAGVRRVVYLGGLVPSGERLSAHLASRLAVEEVLLDALPDALALRASIVVGARSRSFRFLVRLVERVPIMPLPPWTRFRTQPIDGRDMAELLGAAATVPTVAGRSLDAVGPDILSYREMIDRIRDHMLVPRPSLRLPVSLTPLSSRVAAAIAGEDPALIEPLMGSLGSDLLPREEQAAPVLGVRLRSFDRAVERALREWEADEELAAR
ncbi:MAG TPA: NAD-dependent epimerase/dehydratase family protein [Solirubrobacteraceae bacterium]|nr:NAD-dependent epimerase/dehydratase family protein [Solirubrobacteraceae bacterium]